MDGLSHVAPYGVGCWMTYHAPGVAIDAHKASCTHVGHPGDCVRPGESAIVVTGHHEFIVKVQVD